jgi:hypothetical protein
MFRNQIKRITSNVVPFVFVGLFLGLFIGKASWFRQFGLLNDFLIRARINTRYYDSGQMIFMKYFDRGSLMTMLVLLLAFAAVHRLVIGIHERRSLWNFNQTIDRLGSYVAIAWLGLIVGITVAALINQSIAIGVIFLTNAMYPLLFLVEVVLINSILNRNGLLNLPIQNDIYQKLRVGIRLDGLVILILGGLILTYQGKYHSTIYSFTNWVRSLFY